MFVGLLGVLVAVGPWWLYFDLAFHRAPTSRLTQVWLYLHLPVNGRTVCRVRGPDAQRENSSFGEAGRGWS